MAGFMNDELRRIQASMVCGRCAKPFVGTENQARNFKYRGTVCYCSRKCQMDAASERMATPVPEAGPCQACGRSFQSRQKNRKYCSRACFHAGHIRPIEKACEHCGAVFLAAHSSAAGSADQRNKFCSNKCRTESRRVREVVECAECAKPFEIQPAEKGKYLGAAFCCSVACKAKFRVGAMSGTWKGGVCAPDERGRRQVYIASGLYVPLHRLNAAKAIGRQLKPSEIVILVNRAGEPTQENLFICADRSEFNKRKFGTLPWPSESNLGQYK